MAPGLTSTCAVCGAKGAYPAVPNTASYHKTCVPCLELAFHREMWRPRTQTEHDWEMEYPIVVTPLPLATRETTRRRRD